MKAGIITFNSAHNYGAVLQAWALQEYMKEQGYEVDVINFRLPAIDNVYRLFTPEKPYKDEKKNIKVQKKQYRDVKKKTPHKVKTYKKFERFIAKRLHTTAPYYSYTELKNAETDYDVLITGSDQVWNRALTKGLNPAYLLDFGPENAKRISYAVSIGTDPLPEAEQIVMSRKLRRFDYLSVREKMAQEEVSKLTEKEIEIAVDPTFLVTREKFDTIRVKNKVKQPYIYVHNVHLNRLDTRLNEVSEELSERTGLPVVSNRGNYHFKNCLLEALDFGPEEFIDWIAGAEYVVTNSFHATAFAMIYHRNFITIPALRNPERMISLLGRFGLSSHLMESAEDFPQNLAELSIDYKAVEAMKAEYVRASKEFLKKALAGDVEEKESKPDEGYLSKGNHFSCFGCGLCAEKCGQNAITMKYDEEGFCYPEIDPEKCISCGNCKLVCESKAPRSLIPGSKTEDTAGESGFPAYCELYSRPAGLPKLYYEAHIASPLCEAVIKRGGVVIGKGLDAERSVYRVAETLEELPALYKESTMAADLSRGYELIRTFLSGDREVMFLGTTCEAAAVKAAFTGEKNLVTVAYRCRGFTSEKVFRKYAESVEEAYDAKITEVNFANRMRGFTNECIEIKLDNKEVFLEPEKKNSYMMTFGKSRFKRPSCYTCAYVEQLGNAADLVLGYVALPDRKNPYEAKAHVRINSGAGERLLSFCEEGSVIRSEEISMRKEAARGVVQVPPVRASFMEHLEQYPASELFK